MWPEWIHYFQTLEQRPAERLAILVGGLLFFWILEGAIPLFKLPYQKSKLKHAGVNFVFTVIHLIIHTFLALFIVAVADWCKQAEFGITYWTHASLLGTVLIGVLALDFSSWLVHWVMHQQRPPSGQTDFLIMLAHRESTETPVPLFVWVEADSSLLAGSHLLRGS